MKLNYFNRNRITELFNEKHKTTKVVSHVSQTLLYKGVLSFRKN